MDRRILMVFRLWKKRNLYILLFDGFFLAILEEAFLMQIPCCSQMKYFFLKNVIKCVGKIIENQNVKLILENRSIGKKRWK